LQTQTPNQQSPCDNQDRRFSNDKRTPFVSVIIPAFDVAQYIGEALASVFGQTFKDFEVIVINDGSRDSEELERALQPYLNRITYIKQPNRGPSSARNAGIRRARGCFIAVLDADDVWLPEYLAQQLRAFEAEPTLDLIYVDAMMHGEGTRNRKSFMDIFPSTGPVTVEALLEQRCVLITSCVVVRRQVLLEAGLFDENYFRSEDFDLWVRLAHGGGKLAYQRKVLAHHRVRGDSLAADRTRMQRSAIEVYENLTRKLALTPRQRALVETEIAKYRFELALTRGKHELAAGDYGRAIASLKCALALRRGLRWRDLKLRLALFCLRVAPRLARPLYLRYGTYGPARPGQAPLSPTAPEAKTYARLTL